MGQFGSLKISVMGLQTLYLVTNTFIQVFASKNWSKYELHMCVHALIALVKSAWKGVLGNMHACMHAVFLPKVIHGHNGLLCKLLLSLFLSLHTHTYRDICLLVESRERERGCFFRCPELKLLKWGKE